MSYQTYVLQALSPPWLLGTWGARWMTAFADEKDWLDTRLRDSVRARFPTYCPSDGLGYLSEERGIERGPAEPDDDFKERLRLCWESWTWCGTEFGIVNTYRYTGWPDALVAFDPREETWPTDWRALGTVWFVPACDTNFDDRATNWHHFWLFCDGYAEGYTLDTETWGDPGDWDDGGVWDFANPATWEAVERWRRVIRKWKTTGTTCVGLYLIMSDGGWADVWGGNTGLWDGPDEGTWQGDVRFISVGETPT
jgi:hypothetical protein